MPTFGTMTRGLKSRLRDERGFTLIEQLVAAMGLVMVVAAIAGMTEVSQRMSASDNARSEGLRNAQVGLDRMTRELRAAYSFSGAITTTRIVANVLVRGRTYQVTYDCNSAHPDAATNAQGVRQCVRSEAGRSEVVVDKIVNAGQVGARQVFTPTQRADSVGNNLNYYVAVRLEVPAGGERKLGDGKNGSQTHRVVLEDGLYFRNIHASTRISATAP